MPEREHKDMCRISDAGVRIIFFRLEINFYLKKNKQKTRVQLENTDIISEFISTLNNCLHFISVPKMWDSKMALFFGSTWRNISLFFQGSIVLHQTLGNMGAWHWSDLPLVQHAVILTDGALIQPPATLIVVLIPSVTVQLDHYTDCHTFAVLFYCNTTNMNSRICIYYHYKHTYAKKKINF